MKSHQNFCKSVILRDINFLNFLCRVQPVEAFLKNVTFKKSKFSDKATRAENAEIKNKKNKMFPRNHKGMKNSTSETFWPHCGMQESSLFFQQFFCVVLRVG